ncbi:MAG: hypothetical protein H6508_08235 [Calditrichaeota bacterium]|nr:hypothetical protein [Calditrichota bacterium]
MDDIFNELKAGFPGLTRQDFDRRVIECRKQLLARLPKPDPDRTRDPQK